MKPVIFGLSGETITPDERAFFREAEPAGYILFKRNIADAAQLRALTDDLRALAGRDDLLVMIDQEGGRVARMKPPVWPVFPSAEPFDRLYATAPSSAIVAARANARAIAATLHEAGISVDALPLLDLRLDGQSDIIGDRSLGADPMQVAALGRAVLEGLRAGGVVGDVHDDAFARCQPAVGRHRDVDPGTRPIGEPGQFGGADVAEQRACPGAECGRP